MTDIDTEELRRLTAEATPGPWHTVTTTVDLFVDTPERQVASLNREFYGQADAALIVAMRNALPAILDALDAKDREIERLWATLDAVIHDEDGQCVICMGQKPGHFDECEARAPLSRTEEQRCHHGQRVSEPCAECRDDELLTDAEERDRGE